MTCAPSLNAAMPQRVGPASQGAGPASIHVLVPRTSFEYQIRPIGPLVLGGMVLHPFEKARDVLSSQNFAIDGRNGMDSPLYGSTTMSHNAFSIRELIEHRGEISVRRTAPEQVRGIGQLGGRDPVPRESEGK
jgi:hypothetical protein